MKFKKGKKVLSLVLAALMVLSVMPTSMLIQKANAATAFEGGKEVADGTWKGWTWSVLVTVQPLQIIQLKRIQMAVLHLNHQEKG